MRQFRKLYTHNALPANQYLVEHRDVDTSGSLIGYVTHVEIASNTVIPIRHLAIWNIAGPGQFNYQLNIIWGEPTNRLLDVGMIGDIVVISTTGKTTYHIYRDGGYTLNASLSELPDLQIGITDYRDPQELLSSPERKKSWQEALADYIKFVRNEADNEKKYSQGHILLIAAYRMKDNTIIRHSLPFYHPVGPRGVIQTPAMFQYPGVQYPVGSQFPPPGKPMYVVEGAATRKLKYHMEEQIHSKWAEIIKSIDIYACYLPHMSIPETFTFSNVNVQEGIEFPVKEFDTEFKNAMFYKIDSIDLIKPESPGTIDIDITKDINLSNLESKESLRPDQLSMHELCFNKNMLYNGRLHVADTLTYLSEGHKWSLPYMTWQNANNERMLQEYAFLTVWNTTIQHDLEIADFSVLSTGSQTQPIMRVYVDTSEGERIVYRRLPPDTQVIKPAGQSIYWIMLPKVLTYPHPGARRFDICLVNASGNGAVIHSGQFTSHDMYAFAYHILNHPATPFNAGASYPFQDRVINDWDAYADKNRLQLSGIENPFYWPAKNSYRIGEDKHNKIIDMAVQANPTSEGQFGQYPLAVFCMNGIYLVNQGNEDVVYASVINISNIRANPGVMGIEGVIIFSSVHDLHVLEGRNIKTLSRHIIQNKVYNTQSTGTPENPTSDPVSGLTFIQNMTFGYDSQHKEIVIANPEYFHHYRYAPSPRYFTMATYGYDGFVIKHGSHQGYVISGQDKNILTIYDMTQDESQQYVKVFFRTNPFHLGHEGFKKLQRTQFYCHAKTRPGDGYLNMFLFGGNILNEVPLPMVQRSTVGHSAEIIHLIAGRTSISARYFAFMMSGWVRAEDVFHYITTDISAVLPGKLR